MEYQKFIDNKIVSTPKAGFKIKQISEILLPHQADTVTWAADGGKRAIFASFGMGKTLMQLELCLQCLQAYPGCSVLIICPLGVKQEFKKDAEDLLNLSKKHGFEVEYIRNHEEQQNSFSSIHITNYERIRDGNIDLRMYKMVTLDEASALRSVGSKTYIEFLKKFKNVPYKYRRSVPTLFDFLKEGAA